MSMDNDIILQNPHALMDFAVRSNANAKIILSNEQLKNKLNNINKSDTQTFINSCAARAIMLFLRDINKLSPEECTRSKELEIYMQIWSAPGEEADPVKIMDFFNRNHIKVTGIDVCDISKKWLLREIGHSKTNRLAQAYGLFSVSAGKNITKHDSANEFDEDIFSSDCEGLLATKSVNGVHIVLVNKSGDKFCVTNPFDGSKNYYASFDEFTRQDHDFLGVGYMMVR